VRAHVDGLDRISCELSGGMDSTALTFAARATGPAELALLTVAARDRYSEDETWARRAVEAARGGGGGARGGEATRSGGAALGAGGKPDSNAARTRDTGRKGGDV